MLPHSNFLIWIYVFNFRLMFLFSMFLLTRQKFLPEQAVHRNLLILNLIGNTQEKLLILHFSWLYPAQNLRIKDHPWSKFLLHYRRHLTYRQQLRLPQLKLQPPSLQLREREKFLITIYKLLGIFCDRDLVVSLL